jgi:hypothetical protein
MIMKEILPENISFPKGKHFPAAQKNFCTGQSINPAACNWSNIITAPGAWFCEAVRDATWLKKCFR